MFPVPVRTVYDNIRLIRLNLALFGFNVANELPPLVLYCARALALITLPLFLSFLSSAINFRLQPERRKCVVDFHKWVGEVMCALNALFYWFVRMRSERLERLVRDLKRLPAEAEARVNTLFVIFTFFIYVDCFNDLDNAYLYYATASFQDFINVLSAILFKLVVCFFFNFYTPLLFLSSALANHTVVSLNRMLRAVKRSRSPLRRDRLILKVIRYYYRLREMSALMDPLTSAPFYALKILSLIYISIVMTGSAFFFEQEVGWVERKSMLIKVLTVTYFPLLAHFLHLTFKANRMGCAICQCAASFDLCEPEAASGHVIRLRLHLLIQLAHLRVDEGPLTLAGVPIHRDLFYSIFLDWYDSINLLGAQLTGYY